MTTTIKNKFIKFEIEKAEIIEEDTNSQFATAKIRAFSSGPNLHDLVCSENVLQETASTLYNKPILYSIDNVLDDFYTHVDADRNAIAGFIVPESAEFERLDDGRLSLNVLGKIWKLYAPKVVQLFKRDGGKKKISVEMDLFKSEPREDGLQNMLDFAYAGLTILGDYVTEASPGANMSILSFAEENKKVTLEYMKEFGIDSDQFLIPWIIDINNKLNEINGKINSQNFEKKGGGDLVPYSSMKDVNPALKGIKPPISLAQANQIAKEADGIGTDENKNGWAIAIGNFKKRHVVKDDKWVAKEKMTAEIEEFAKDNWGTGDAITVDKSKDAMSSSPWGNVDKTALKNTVLKAKNYKSLVKDIYAKVDEGWEDHPSSSLHYPIMQVSGGKAVYNRYGLAQALLRAEAQNESGVVSKVHGLYSKLGLEAKQEKMALSKEKEDEELEKMAKETPEDEKKEDPKEEAKETPKEEKKENMSFDFSAMFAEGEDENFADLQAEFAKGDAMDHMKIMNAMYAKFCTLQTQMAQAQTEKEEMSAKFAEADKKAKAYMAENEELKQFKAQKEQEQFTFAVDATLKELEETVEIPLETLDEMREDSKNFSLDDVDAWKNKVKAQCLDFAIKGKSNEDSVKRYALPFINSERTVNNGSPWIR